MKTPASNNYNRFKDLSYDEYRKLGDVFCPNLSVKVKFNSEGFWHIVYISKNKKREINSQLMRFKLLSKAAKLISLTTTLQEYDLFTTELDIDDHSIRVKKLVKVEYFGYIAIIDGWKIKTIVKKIGNGQPFYWSVIPNWITNKKRDVPQKYKNSVGNLEED